MFFSCITNKGQGQEIIESIQICYKYKKSQTKPNPHTDINSEDRVKINGIEIEILQRIIK